MSSSDYIAIKKLKELKSSCETDELGDPLSPSWYNVPVTNDCDCSVVLGTGPTGAVGSIGPIGYTGYTGVTGPVGPTNGGVISIFAESNGFDLSSGSGFSFSYGSGNVNSDTYGIQMGIDCSLNYIGVRASETPEVSGVIQVWKNNTYSGIQLFGNMDRFRQYRQFLFDQLVDRLGDFQCVFTIGFKEVYRDRRFAVEQRVNYRVFIERVSNLRQFPQVYNGSVRLCDDRDAPVVFGPVFAPEDPDP